MKVKGKNCNITPFLPFKDSRLDMRWITPSRRGDFLVIVIDKLAMCRCGDIGVDEFRASRRCRIEWKFASEYRSPLYHGQSAHNVHI